MHGLHCVQTKALLVSATARRSSGGVPTEIFMRYVEGTGVRGDCIVCLDEESLGVYK